MSRKTHWAQAALLVIVSLLIIFGSVGSTLYFTGVSFGDFSHQVGDVLGLEYKNVTLTDARLSCEKELRTRFEGRIQVMHVDTLSSRLDPAEDVFKVFMEADIYSDSSRQGAPRKMFMNCFVSAQRGHISSFEAAGDSQEGWFRAIN